VLNLLSSLHVTAAGDKNLSEEAVHLTGGMLAAEHVGNVIATTWSIMDDDAPLVVAEIYSRLVRDPELDSTGAAHSLHHAVRRLRKQLKESGKPFLNLILGAVYSCQDLNIRW